MHRAAEERKGLLVRVGVGDRCTLTTGEQAAALDTVDDVHCVGLEGVCCARDGDGTEKEAGSVLAMTVRGGE